MSTKNNRNCQKAAKRTIAHCLRAQTVGGDAGVILQRTIAIVSEVKRCWCHITRVSEGVTLVSRSAGQRRGQAGGVKWRWCSCMLLLWQL